LQHFFSSFRRSETRSPLKTAVYIQEASAGETAHPLAISVPDSSLTSGTVSSPAAGHNSNFESAISERPTLFQVSLGITAAPHFSIDSRLPGAVSNPSSQQNNRTSAIRLPSLCVFHGPGNYDLHRSLPSLRLVDFRLRSSIPVFTNDFPTGHPDHRQTGILKVQLVRSKSLLKTPGVKSLPIEGWAFWY
jgi:hypothetical protein